MNKQQRNIKKLLFSGVLFLMLFMCVSVDTEAAWKKNSDGTYSYYSNGTLLKSKWINGTYYVNSKGIRQTGWMYKGGKWYYFAKNTGKVIKSQWIKSGNNMYYARSNGQLYTSGKYKIGSYYYGFNARGVRLTGKQKINGKYYYFSTKNGQMQVKKWCATSKVYYYYGSDGAMVTNQWVGRYYVGSTGKRLTSQWKDNRYLNSSGKCVSGLQKISGVYYYFDTETYKKVTSTTMTISGVTYKFDSNGKGTVVEEDEIPATTVNVASGYYTDKVATDLELITALIHCESGNQSYAGQVAVGLVVMNRVNSPLFPNTVREVIYQKGQLTPGYTQYAAKYTAALNGTVTISSTTKQAAQEVVEKMAAYKAGQTVKLTVDGKEIEFPHLFFMTKPAYTSLGLCSAYTQIGDHVFFEKWK